MAESKDYRVLVVDDEDDIRMYLSVALEDAGFQVDTADSGKAALEKVRENRPDFISLDLVMPGGSGIAFLHELRRNREWINIPVMIVTGHARDELGKADLSKALEGKLLSGPQTYLEKPVTPLKYVAAVRETLGLDPVEPPPKSEDDLRDEAARLVRDLSPDQLEEVLKLMKKR